MHIIQILLPLFDNAGDAFTPDILKGLQEELLARFGGLTAYTRAPAKGIWGSTSQASVDDIVIVEVMAETLDSKWWHDFRLRWQKTLRQETLVVRSFPISLL
jgi:hypothetical protein